MHVMFPVHSAIFHLISVAQRRSLCIPLHGGGSHTHTILKLVGSFGRDSVCLTEGSIVRNLRATSLIITGGPDWLSVPLVIVPAYKYYNMIGNVKSK